VFSSVLAVLAAILENSFTSSHVLREVLVENGKIRGLLTLDEECIECDCVIVSYPAYQAINQLFEANIFDNQFISKVNRLNKTTSVVEVHFALSNMSCPQA
jgi:hypothetical protein